MTHRKSSSTSLTSASLALPDVRANVFFSDLSEKEIAGLLKVCTVHTFAPGERILRENDATREIFVILKGTTRIGKVLYAGDEKELGSLGPGEFFGEMAFLDGGPRSASVWAAEETVALKIDKDSFEKLAARAPRVAYKVTMKIACSLAERLRTSNDVVEDFFSNPNKAILESKTRLMKIQSMLLRR